MPTWDDFRERESAGWIFLPPFPTVSHSALASSELTEDVGGVGLFVAADVGETTGASFFSLFVTTGGGCRDSGRASSGPSSPGKLQKGDQSRHSASRQVYVRRP